MGKKDSAAPAAALRLYEALVATQSGAFVKGAANRYTAVNGNMYSFLDKAGLVSLRLGKDARESFLTAHKTTLSVQYGAVMKEYVLVPASMLEQTAGLAKYFAMSYRYALSLPAKATTRPAKKTAAKKTAAKKTPAKKAPAKKAPAKKKTSAR